MIALAWAPWMVSIRCQLARPMVNGLKIYEYLKHLLTEIPKHMDETSLDFLDNLLPWSENLPEECRKQT